MTFDFCHMRGKTEHEIMPIYAMGDKKLVISDSCYIAAEAVIIGEVTLDEDVSIMSGRRAARRPRADRDRRRRAQPS